MNRPKKFSVQTNIQDFSRKVTHVANSVPCARHSASVGWACWYLTSDDGTLRNAICGNRVKKMYTGTPTERASTDKYTYKRKQKENAA